MLGAFKRDTLLDLEFSSKFVTKPMKACLPHERLFQGETDGSSFPNGGLRVTHSAAAFTTWDRASPPFVHDKCLYIPCAFVTHFGKCIDEKTPLLRSMDAVKLQGLRLLKSIGIGTDAQTMHSYLGWEQEILGRTNCKATVGSKWKSLLSRRCWVGFLGGADDLLLRIVWPWQVHFDRSQSLTQVAAVCDQCTGDVNKVKMNMLDGPCFWLLEPPPPLPPLLPSPPPTAPPPPPPKTAPGRQKWRGSS
ncbi:unnamed protein product [Effrenium voratum]|nr:unnamed protein product [Effrenium voratum]